MPTSLRLCSQEPQDGSRTPASTTEETDKISQTAKSTRTVANKDKTRAATKTLAAMNRPMNLQAWTRTIGRSSVARVHVIRARPVTIIVVVAHIAPSLLEVNHAYGHGIAIVTEQGTDDRDRTVTTPAEPCDAAEADHLTYNSSPSSSSTSLSDSSESDSSATNSSSSSSSRHRHHRYRRRHKRHREFKWANGESPFLSCAPTPSRRTIQRIRKGKYVNFDLLLCSADDIVAAHLPQALPTARRSKKKTAKRSVTDPQSWMEAWNVYLLFWTHTDPSWSNELIKYQALIWFLFQAYPVAACLKYDNLFRHAAA